MSPGLVETFGVEGMMLDGQALMEDQSFIFVRALWRLLEVAS